MTKAKVFLKWQPVEHGFFIRDHEHHTRITYQDGIVTDNRPKLIAENAYEFARIVLPDSVRLCIQVEDTGLRDIADFYQKVMARADKIMADNSMVSGAHWNALCQIAAEYGITPQLESKP